MSYRVISYFYIRYKTHRTFTTTADKVLAVQYSSQQFQYGNIAQNSTPHNNGKFRNVNQIIFKAHIIPKHKCTVITKGMTIWDLPDG